MLKRIIFYFKEYIMEEKRGKKAKYIIYAQSGFLLNIDLEKTLEDYPTELIKSIRKKLNESIPNLTEKYNCNAHYFGYCKNKDADRVYIYLQKKQLRIDLQLDKKYINEIKNNGFEIVRVENNFQDQKGWITGWHVPHSTKDLTIIMNYLTKVFE